MLKLFKKSMCINGRTYSISGCHSISVINDKVFVDGIPYHDPKDGELTADVINITVEGDVTGNVENECGDIKCGNVGGSVSTASGDIKCSNITGDATTVSGDVVAEYIQGNCRTVSGDISS